MSNVSELATFQLNTQQISQTIPTSEIGEIASSQSNSASGQGMERVDSPHAAASGPNRAAQLQAFTEWLSSRDGVEHHDPDAFVSKPLQVAADNSGQVFRVDSKTQHSSKLQYQSPHFSTKNYVEAIEVNNSRTPLIPTDGFDPGIENAKARNQQQILSAINELKADGRVLGDSEQPHVNSISNLIVPAFRWPSVSNNLLGSPAMINLENNIRQSLQTYRTQIVVSSAQRNAGASTVAVSLARQLVENDHSVLLIDADLENPSLANQLGLTTPMSWTQAIHDGRPTNQLIIKERNAGLSLLPLAKPESSFSTTEKIFDNLATISNPLAWIYDFVVIDVGPVSQYLAHSSNAKIRAASTLLVSDCSQLNENEAHTQHAKLRLFGAESILMVQNFSRMVTAAKVG